MLRADNEEFDVLWRVDLEEEGFGPETGAKVEGTLDGIRSVLADTLGDTPPSLISVFGADITPAENALGGREDSSPVVREAPFWWGIRVGAEEVERVRSVLEFVSHDLAPGRLSNISTRSVRAYWGAPRWDGASTLPLGATELDTDTGDLTGYQGYLTDVGIDGATQYEGGTGEGVQIVEVEAGEADQHEAFGGRLEYLRRGSVSSHATAALGVACGRQAAPNRGIRGLAPGALPRSFPLSLSEGAILGIKSERMVENRIYSLGAKLRAGDVVLLELQFVKLPTEPKALWPPDEWPTLRVAIDELVKRGVYVILAAGNGEQKLSPFAGMLAEDYGGIVVGAADPETRRRMWFSNHNDPWFPPRVHIHSWGQRVATAGSTETESNGMQWFDLQKREDPSRCYTQSFSGTSSAASIVAGLVAALSGILKANLPAERRVSAHELRRVLRRSGRKDSDCVAIGPFARFPEALTMFQDVLGFEARKRETRSELPLGRFR